MYICVGLVLVFRHIFKPRNVKCNIFSELTPKTSLLFFHLKILKFVAEKSCVTIETRTELCVEIRCVKICCAWQTKFTWYLKPENQTLSINVAFSFFKFRKYNTAFNSGLKIWLVSDFPAENPLLNGMFCYICIGLVLNLRHNF